MAPPPETTPEPDDTATTDDQADTGLVQQPVFTFPAPPTAVPGTQVFVPVNGGVAVSPGSAGAAPVITLQPNPNGQPAIYNFVPNPDGSVPAPAPPPGVGTFGVVGSPQPGMIQQPVTTQPAQPQRPPGR